MAEKEKKAEVAAPAAKKADKPAKKDKVKFTERIAKFWRDYATEFKKIVWPTKEDTVKNTAVVVASIVAVGICVAILDFLFSQGLTLLSHL